MFFKILQTKKDKKSFIDFYYSVYKDSPCFVDTEVFVLKDMLYEKTLIQKDLTIIANQVINDNKICCQSILFMHKSTDLLYLGYFEALENKSKEVEYLLNNAKAIGKDNDKKKVVIGINGHISCGVGILQDSFNIKQSFDSRYSKSYYKDYFKDLEYKDAYTYILDLPSELKEIRKCSFDYRFFNKKRFNEEMLILTDLCNKTLSRTSYYYHMSNYHMKELLKGMKVFLKKENIIFLLKDNKEIGFLFWHPDYNKLFKTGTKNNVFLVFFKHLFKKIDKCKINAVGIIKEFNNTLALKFLLDIFVSCAKDFNEVETTFIWKDNKESLSVSSKRMRKHKSYKVYEMNID